MTTLTTAVTLVCIVADQIGVVRNVPSDRIYVTNAVIFPCYLDDNQALAYYNLRMKELQQQLCPDCMR